MTSLKCLKGQTMTQKKTLKDGDFHVLWIQVWFAQLRRCKPTTSCLGASIALRCIVKSGINVNMWMLDRCEWKGWYFWFQKGVILHVHHDMVPGCAILQLRCIVLFGSRIPLASSWTIRRCWLAKASRCKAVDTAPLFSSRLNTQLRNDCWMQIVADIFMRYLYEQHINIQMFHDISAFRHCLLASLQRPSFADRAEGHLPIWQWMQTSELLSHSRKAFTAKCWSGRCIITHNTHVWYIYLDLPWKSTKCS